MQQAVSPRRYPTNINHTPRDFERRPSENFVATHYRHTDTCAELKLTERPAEGVPAMAAATAITITQIPGEGTAASRPTSNILRKASSLMAPRPLSHIRNRHSWASSGSCPPRDLESSRAMLEVQEDDGPSTPVRRVKSPESAESPSLLSSKKTFFTNRPGATFDMAYFLRNTGPPSPPRPSRETPQEESPPKVGRKKHRSLFRSKRKEPDPEPAAIAVAPEEQKPSSIFVPPEGVEQKTTAGGNKYLQIVAHPDLLNLGNTCPPDFIQRGRGLSSAKSNNTEAVSSDELDTWISTFSIHNHDVADFSVKPPLTIDTYNMETTESNSSLVSPRTPLSFVSEARSLLPSAESGFGLSIMDGPTMQPYCNGAVERSEALCSDSASDPSSSTDRKHVPAASVETAELPLLDGRREPTREWQTLQKVESKHNSRHEDHHKFDRRSNDVLAGQGLRRPAKDQDTDFVTPELYPAASIQSARDREAVVRAIRINTLQASRRNIDHVVEEQNMQHESPSPAHEFENVFGADAQQRPQSPLSNPSHHIIGMTDTMTFAGQWPLPRGRHGRRPSSLVLREPSITRQHQAVRSSFSEISPITSTARQRNPMTPPPPNVPPKSSTRTTISATTFFTPHSYPSAARHFSTPLSPAASLTPQAVTATTTSSGGLRTSLCSSHTSHSKETRLEARLDALERENKLLEAALMAVLKTSGTLNRCPCGVLKEHSDGASKSTEQLVATKPAVTPLPRAAGSELKRVKEEDAGLPPPVATSSSSSSTRTRRNSMDSNGSGVSALEVYLRTRVGPEVK